MLNNIMPIFEFLLWDNCNNNCNFCWQKHQHNFLTDKQKIDSIDLVIKFLTSKCFVANSHIMLVGGELFDNLNCQLFDNLLDLINQIIKLQLEKTINFFYLNTNLLYENTSFLEKILDKIEKANLFSKLKFTTSYDVYGRFSVNKEKLFFKNLKLVKEKYSDIQVVVNSILTKQLCNKILSEKFDIVDFFKKEHSCYVNLLPYIALDNEMTPTRFDVLRALQYIGQNNTGYLKKYIQNFDLPQDKLIYKYENGNLVFKSSGFNNCGHGINFNRYSDKGSCFICDIKELFDA